MPDAWRVVGSGREIRERCVWFSGASAPRILPVPCYARVRAIPCPAAPATRPTGTDARRRCRS
jgi:hypothetical protein